MIDWYYQEQMQEYKKNMMLAAAMINPDKFMTFADEYRKSLFPTDKDNEKFMEEQKEILEQESSKSYEVRPLVYE